MKSFICVAVFALFLTIAESCERKYSCVDSKTVNIFGANLTCQNDEVCNEFNAGHTCAPCVKQRDKCGKLFRCVDGQVNLGGATLNCPTDYHCNAEGKGACPICVPDICPGVRDYECSATEPTKVIYQNVETFCRNGYICNAEFVKPCSICILQKKRFLLF